MQVFSRSERLLPNRRPATLAEKLSSTLPAEMVRVIREKGSAGHYGSTSEVVRDALRIGMDRARRPATLDASIERGLADAAAGRVKDIDAVRLELSTRLEAEPSASRR